jgi:hypothetical protein
MHAKLVALARSVEALEHKLTVWTAPGVTIGVGNSALLSRFTCPLSGLAKAAQDGVHTLAGLGAHDGLHLWGEAWSRACLAVGAVVDVVDLASSGGWPRGKASAEFREAFCGAALWLLSPLVPTAMEDAGRGECAAKALRWLCMFLGQVSDALCSGGPVAPGDGHTAWVVLNAAWFAWRSTRDGTAVDAETLRAAGDAVLRSAAAVARAASDTRMPAETACGVACMLTDVCLSVPQGVTTVWSAVPALLAQVHFADAANVEEVGRTAVTVLWTLSDGEWARVGEETVHRVVHEATSAATVRAMQGAAKRGVGSVYSAMSRLLFTVHESRSSAVQARVAADMETYLRRCVTADPSLEAAGPAGPVGGPVGGPAVVRDAWRRPLQEALGLVM